MADIQFDEEQQYQQNDLVEQKPFLVRLVLATKIVSTDRQAEYALLGIVITVFVISGLIFFKSQSGDVIPTTELKLINTVDQSQFVQR